MKRYAWGCRFLLLGLFAAAALAAHAKAVVVFYGLEWRANANRVVDQVLREELGVLGRGSDLQYHSEFIDNSRFPGDAQEDRLAEFLRARYADAKVDVVIAMDPTGIRFLAKHRDRIFPGVPVAMGGIRDVTLARLHAPPDFVGRPFLMNASQTMDLALRLRPEASEIVIITGVAELDRAMEESLRAAAAALAPTRKTRVLSGLSLDAVVKEVSALPKDAVIVTGPFGRDGAGQFFPNAFPMIQRVHAVAPVPIVHTFETAVGIGALASASVTVESVPRQAAAVAKQLLAGVAPSAVVLPPPDAPVPFVDWRELKRWHIPESRLPEGTVVRFRELTLWDQYRYHALAALSAVLLQSALITLLLVQKRRRARIELMLRQNEETMTLAADAAKLAVWSWNIERDVVTRMSTADNFRSSPESGSPLQAYVEAIHGPDQEIFTRAIRRAVEGDGLYEAEYRVPDPEGNLRWYSGRGAVERSNGKPVRLRGVTLDITSRKSAELDAQHRRNELAHLARVNMVGELSGSIAHELNQPLTAILANAQAAQMFIRHEPVDMVELASILDDIVENDKRAGDIIQSLRKMLKKEESEQVVLGINEVVQEVLRLMHNDLVNRQVTVEMHLAPGNPLVKGDRTQLQQVVLNLLLNACDAMAQLPRSERILGVATEVGDGKVRVRVADHGHGIAPGELEQIFAPFFTTKPHGLGLGLAVCRTIVASHGGVLNAENNRERGATFTFVLDAKSVAFA